MVGQSGAADGAITEVLRDVLRAVDQSGLPYACALAFAAVKEAVGVAMIGQTSASRLVSEGTGACEVFDEATSMLKVAYPEARTPGEALKRLADAGFRPLAARVRAAGRARHSSAHPDGGLCLELASALVRGKPPGPSPDLTADEEAQKGEEDACDGQVVAARRAGSMQDDRQDSGDGPAAEHDADAAAGLADEAGSAADATLQAAHRAAKEVPSEDEPGVDRVLARSQQATAERLRAATAVERLQAECAAAEERLTAAVARQDAAIVEVMAALGLQNEWEEARAANQAPRSVGAAQPEADPIPPEGPVEAGFVATRRRRGRAFARAGAGGEQLR